MERTLLRVVMKLVILAGLIRRYIFTKFGGVAIVSADLPYISQKTLRWLSTFPWHVAGRGFSCSDEYLPHSSTGLARNRRAVWVVSKMQPAGTRFTTQT